MNANEVLRIVDSLHREKNIDKEILFRAIEQGLVSAVRKYYGEEADVEVIIERATGQIIGRVGQETLEYEDVVGRIGAQTAKQVIIHKVREAERDSQVLEFNQLLDEMISGTVNRNDGRVTTVTLGGIEAILPRSEQIPGETHTPNERIRAVVTEVKPQGNRVKVVLSRTRPRLVQRLFEQEIPEIAEGVITIKAISREPGHRSKVAVNSIDSKVDCVGACVGVRGNRIKSIIEELGGERIDIVRYDEDPQVLIKNSLMPAEVDEVILCRMMGRAIVLVREDQLSLAIGKRGQNVRLASKLCGWDIEIMTQEELEKQIEKAVAGFSAIKGVTDELANRLVGEGYLSYDDLSVIEPTDLQEMGGLSEEDVDYIVEQAEVLAEQAERLAKENPSAPQEKKLFTGRYDQPPAAPSSGAAGGGVTSGGDASGGDASSGDASSGDKSSGGAVAESPVAGESAAGDSSSPEAD